MTGGEPALAEVESGELLEGLAEALYLERQYAAAAAHYERAYSAYRRQHDSVAAGRAARMVAWITGNVLGDWAVRSGWLARARVLLEEAGEDRPEHGWVLRPPGPADVRVHHRARPPRTPPPELQQLLGAVHGNQDAMDGFTRVIAGVTSPAEFFSEQNVQRIMSRAAATTRA